MADIGLRVESEVEDDKRWIAEVVELPGVLAYGTTEKEAVASQHKLSRFASSRIAPDYAKLLPACAN